MPTRKIPSVNPDPLTLRNTPTVKRRIRTATPAKPPLRAPDPLTPKAMEAEIQRRVAADSQPPPSRFLMQPGDIQLITITDGDKPAKGKPTDQAAAAQPTDKPNGDDT